MMRLPLFRVLSACALTALVAAQPGMAQDVPPAPQLLPPNVYAYAAIPDVQALKERGGQSSFGELLQDPQLDPVLEQLRAKFEENAGKIEEKLGVTVEELLAVPAGEVAFAVCDIPGQTVGLVAIIEYGESADTVNTLLEKAEASMEKRGATRDEVDFEGTTIITHKGDEAEVDADSGSEEVELDIEGDGDSGTADPPDFKGNLAWFQKDGYLVLGNSAPVLEAVLARWNGEHAETFAGNEVYSYIVAQTKVDDRAPVLEWFVDPMGGLQAALSRAENLPPQAQMAAGMLPILGLTNLKGIGGGFDLSTEKFNSISKTFVYVETPSGGDLGLLGVFQLLPGELAPPQWVSQEVTAYVGAHWDAAGAMDSAKRLVDTFQGPGAFDRLMDKAANTEGGPKIHPKKDLIDRLTGVIHLANYPIEIPEGDAQTPPQQPTVIALDVNDEAGIKDVLAKFANTPNFPGTTREFEGTTLYELPTGTPGGAVVLTVANNSLMISSNVELIEQILRDAEASALAEAEGYQQVAGHFPDETLMISYQDQQDQMKAIYEMFRSGKVGEEIEGFDPSTLPPFEDIAKYMRRGGGYGVADERGALFVSFTLKENGEIR